LLLFGVSLPYSGIKVTVTVTGIVRPADRGGKVFGEAHRAKGTDDQKAQIIVGGSSATKAKQVKVPFLLVPLLPSSDVFPRIFSEFLNTRGQLPRMENSEKQKARSVAMVKPSLLSTVLRLLIVPGNNR
jgi:hypothetical protein